ncbi:MAG TPA: hypothetical protein VMR18_04700 [Candidatus Saccharimonadales bacterium]|nr:hypothetical protein [Candidatus Saccharimonadales bacterium]
MDDNKKNEPVNGRPKNYWRLHPRVITGAIIIVILLVGYIGWHYANSRKETPDQQAINLINKQLKTTSNSAVELGLYQSLATYCQAENDQTCTHQALNNAAKLVPNNITTLTQFGDLAMSSGDKTSALKYYTQARNLIMQTTGGTNQSFALEQIETKIKQAGG